jgi:hypothetical protein
VRPGVLLHFPKRLEYEATSCDNSKTKLGDSVSTSQGKSLGNMKLTAHTHLMPTSSFTSTPPIRLSGVVVRQKNKLIIIFTRKV